MQLLRFIGAIAYVFFILYLICIDVAEFYIDNFSVISGDSDILF